jgi:hypothetical protein
MRSERRHPLVRIKHGLRYGWGLDLRQQPGALGRAVRTARACSGRMRSGSMGGESNLKVLRVREAWRGVELS